MNERFLVLQHVAVEHPGILRDFMRADGITWDTVELDAGEALPTLDGYAALVVMGGPMDTWEEDLHPWLVAEKALIYQAVVRRRLPYLGICLGHQLLAAATGGMVGRAAHAEIGVLPVKLTPAGRDHPYFRGVAPAFDCLQWHGAEVVLPPPDATVLAASADCRVQALAIGSHAFGFQFHVEVGAATVDEWNAIPAYRNGLERALGAGGAERFRAETAAALPAFNALARTLYDNWRRHAFSAAH